MCTDTLGNRYATVKDTKEGDVLIVDGGFTCIHKDSERTVKKARTGDLYIDCKDGHHLLDGQIDEKEGVEFYLGLYPKE